MGQGSTANGATASAFGQGSVANGNATTALGQGSTAGATGATAVGQGATASGTNSVAVGVNAAATGANAIAIGAGATATGSVAVGTGASAANGGAAFGDGASATFANSSAFGPGAVSMRANQMMFGTASQTYTMPGLTSAASLAAQSGPTRFVTTDLNGNLAATGFGPQDIAGLSANVSSLNQSVADLQHGLQRSYEGTAIAIALGGAALPSDKRYAVSVNWGTFRGQNGAGVSALLRLNSNAVFNAGVGAGFAQGGVGGRAGLTFAW
jgi:hypothetical protein